MAVGDAVTTSATVTTTNYLDLQPGSGVEWIIHNVYYSGAVELYVYNGTLSLKYDADATYGGKEVMCMHCTNTYYYRVKNVSGGDIVVSYNGMVSK